MYGKYTLFYESPKNWGYYAHAQTVCTRPLLGGGEGPGDEASPGQVGHRASVPGKDHPCGRVYFDTAGGCGRALLRRAVNHSNMYELSPFGLHCGFDFAIALGVSWCGFDVCETPLSGKVTEHL